MSACTFQNPASGTIYPSLFNYYARETLLVGTTMGGRETA